MMYIVTGSEGFLGRSVVSRLSSDGCAIIAVDRVYHRPETLPGVIHHHADLADPQYLMPVTAKAAQPFTLIHLAWDMRRYEGYAIQAEQVRQFADLLDFWGQRGLQRVIAMGSAEEYGQRSGRLSESDGPGFPLSAYGWAKRSARDLAQAWSMKTTIPTTWLRPFIMYGPGQRGDMLIPSAIEAARQKQKTAFTDGRQRRDFVYIDDVVDALAVSMKAEMPGFQEFNIGRGEEIPVADVLMAIARHYRVESLFDLGARTRRPGEPEVQIADTSRAQKLLGWRAGVSCAQGMQRLLM